MSGNSYKKSSISCLGLLGGVTLGPAIAPTNPKRSFPIFPLPIFGRTKGVVVLTLNSFFEREGCFGKLLNGIFSPPGAGGG